MKRLLGIVLTAEIANSAYLYASESASLFYLANIFIHLGFGFLLLVVLFLFFRRQYQEMQPEARLAGILLFLAGLLGVVLIYTGATRPYQWLLTVHVIVACAGAALTFLHLVVRRHRWRWFSLVPLASLLLVFLVVKLKPEPDRIENPPAAALSMEEEGPGPSSPFFPSAVNTNLDGVIPSDFLMEPESCARSGCHPDIYKQWSTSAHHFASFNNQWYRKSIEYMQDVVGTEPSKWCGGCHDHALLFSGMMDRPMRGQMDQPEAHAGLTCVSCHAIARVSGTTGNGGFTLEYPALHELATSENPIIRALHDWLVRLDPGPHKTTFMKPFMRDQPAEFCSACHKTHLDAPVNHFRWVRGFNEYDGWQSGAASGQGAQAFYDLDEPRNCVDCHMPLVTSGDAGNVAGVVHDHRFPGANTALPYVNGHLEQLELVSQFLKNDQLEVDVFALQISSPGGIDSPQRLSVEEEGSGLFGPGASYTAVSETVAPLNRVRPVVRRGDSVRVDVVVRTKGIGHFFPGGTADAFDVWVDLKAVDDKGKLIFWSGYVPTLESGKKGVVDPGAHFYRALFLDGHGNRIDKRNIWAARSTVYARSIPPGAADLVRYRLQIPEDAGDRIFLDAKVQHRKFSWWNTQFAYAGIRDPKDAHPDFAADYDDGKWLLTGDTSSVSGELKEIPDLPITTMASTRAEIVVSERSASPPRQDAVYRAEDAERWNSYGIALLLQRDYLAAEQVLRRVTENNPGYSDGWINLGRSLLLLGRPEEAKDSLIRALDLKSDLGKAHFFLAITAIDQGDANQALVHLREAESIYPTDRRILFQLGKTLVGQQQYVSAIEVLKRGLQIDPEDSQIHYQLSLCYDSLGEKEKAGRELLLYERFRPRIAAPFGSATPEDENERHPIHEHVSYPLDKIQDRSSEDQPPLLPTSG